MFSLGELEARATHTPLLLKCCTNLLAPARAFILPHLWNLIRHLDWKTSSSKMKALLNNSLQEYNNYYIPQYEQNAKRQWSQARLAMLDVNTY
jgi:hypothetical protein